MPIENPPPGKHGTGSQFPPPDPNAPQPADMEREEPTESQPEDEERSEA